MMHRHRMLYRHLIQSVIVVASLMLGFDAPAVSASTAELNLDGYDQSCGIDISQQAELIRVSWPIQDRGVGQLTFNLSDGLPLVHSMAISSAEGSSPQVIAESLDPVNLLRVGKRDLAKRDGWTIFFDRMQEKPHELYEAVIECKHVRATSRGNRATVVIGDVTAGPFTGELQWTFFFGSPFVLQEMVVSTPNNGVAYLYDTGLICRNASPNQMVWQNTEGNMQTQPVAEIERSSNIPVHGRAICAEFDGGSIALFPPPHRYFYPLDFSDNLKNIWIGPGYAERELPFGFGIRHSPRGDNRYVPWFNAPPDTQQQLGVFLQLCDQSPEVCLAEVAALTRDDHFKPLPGYKVLSSHFHVEHTQEVLEAQEASSTSPREDARIAHTPSGDTYQIPKRLESPGFVEVLRGMGIDAVHLAEFHFGRTPRMNTSERMRHLEVLHAECRRLSSNDFLLLPGEEPNVHFGGHWISFFPQPVHWVLNRPEGTPLVSEHPQFGKVYHVGSEADVLQMLKAERGLAWTAHPRIKGSTGFPDNYRQQLFFTSDQFLGGAWKAMPADLSQPRLGSRVLDLLDDMANWGDPKYVLGEVDVFKIEPDHELYGHMNVNYLRLDHLPKFDDGWQAILDALRDGHFFVTSGEVLIPEFTVNGTPSGEVAKVDPLGSVTVSVDLQWTFPLDRMEIISGDGRHVNRQQVDLSNTEAFGTDSLTVEVDLEGSRWIRVEIWDVATNGAFTQPVWLEVPRP